MVSAEVKLADAHDTISHYASMLSEHADLKIAAEKISEAAEGLSAGLESVKSVVKENVKSVLGYIEECECQASWSYEGFEFQG